MLLRQNPTAGRTFCAYLSQAVPVERVADLIVALRDHLLSSAPALGKARAAAEAGPSKGGKGRKGRKQTKAVVTSHEEAEEERAEVPCLVSCDSFSAGCKVTNMMVQQ